jgi:uncharacterized protein YecE (DUF72 family)
MARPWEMKDKFDLITADFTYVRWLGDRKGIEEKTTTWNKVIVDRQGDLSEWVSLLKKVQERRIMILAFANNHYAGHAPSTVELFRRLWGICAGRHGLIVGGCLGCVTHLFRMRILRIFFVATDFYR